MGCFGKVSRWFIRRQIMPAQCANLRCISLRACFRESYSRQTGIKVKDLDPSFSYNVPKKDKKWFEY